MTRTTVPCPSGNTDCTVDCGRCKGTGFAYGTAAPMPESYTGFLDQAKRVKESTVAAYDGTDQTTDDICPAVLVHVTEPFELQVLAVAPRIDRDMGLAIARILCTALRPEYVTFMADAHTANEMINPATGKQWGPGEMQNACDVEGACSVGMLDDCLMFTTVWRDTERARTEILVYTVDKGEGVGGSTIRWDGYGPAHRVMDTEDVEKASLSGVVPDDLRASLRDTSVSKLLEVFGDAMGLTPEQAFAHSAMGALKALGAGGITALVLTENEFLLKRLQEDQ